MWMEKIWRFDVDRVPMFFVHVITGPHLLVTIAKLEGEVGITFQICRCGHFVERSEREHFPADFEDDHIGTEWRSFGRLRFAQAIFAKLREIHQLTRGMRMFARSLIATRSCFIESRSRKVTVSRSAESFSQIGRASCRE